MSIFSSAFLFFAAGCFDVIARPGDFQKGSWRNGLLRLRQLKSCWKCCQLGLRNERAAKLSCWGRGRPKDRSKRLNRFGNSLLKGAASGQAFTAN
mmetsp:Transcript_6446/g.10178  ORF Transcript_6446/g.10178 Transcript_6446/m.10178 type:complete len:95 (-) Transcript_6446:289-573(-)